MDKSIYLAMNGAQQALTAQKVHTNNLANVNVKGYKADILYAKAVTQADKKQYPVSQAMSISSKAGVLEQTNNPKDIALPKSEQWFVVNNGLNDALSRNVTWQVSANGELTDSKGNLLLNKNDSPIQVPDYQSIDISEDGRVTIIPTDGSTEFVELGKLKVVEVSGPISKRVDGSFFTNQNATATVIDNPTVVVGFQEGSNVSTMETMTQMMDLNRYFENQMSVMEDFKESASLATKLLDIS